jgi:Protein of unknown function (DUF3152)
VRRVVLAAAVIAAIVAPASQAPVVATSAPHDRDVTMPAAVPLAAPAAPRASFRPARATGRPGRLRVVPGTNGPVGDGPVSRYAVEVESTIRIKRRAFAEKAHATLSDRRSWGGTGRVAFRRVSSGRIDFRVTLARPATVDRLCAPLITNGIYSCAMGGRAVLNLRRWRNGADAYSKLARYRKYLVNHEVGHLLGHGHLSCPASGALAPVMMQQTKGVGLCRPNPWPLGYERG